MYSSVGQLLLQLSLLFFLLSLVTADPESPGLLGEATKVSTILIVHLKENHLVLFKYKRQCFTLYSMCFDALKPVFCWDSLPRDSGSMSSERPFKIHEIGISTVQIQQRRTTHTLHRTNTFSNLICSNIKHNNITQAKAHTTPPPKTTASNK